MGNLKMHLPPFKPNPKDTVVRVTECHCPKPSKSGRKYMGWEACDKCSLLIRT